MVSASGHAAPYRPAAPSDLYPSRGEAIALLAKVVEPEVIEALRSVVPDADGDPGREFWIAYAKDLAKDLRRIKNDPDLNGQRDAPPKSAYMPTAKKGNPGALVGAQRRSPKARRAGQVASRGGSRSEGRSPTC